MSDATRGAVDPLVGRTLGGRYRVERLVGRGAMGAVYEATQLDLGRAVALKALSGSFDEKALARLHDEALTAASLSHPNVVAVLELCQAKGDDPPFLVMELLRGRSLHDELKSRGRLSKDAAVAVAGQMLLALEAAHAAGVLHRDVKPANVLVVGDLDRAPAVKLVDFGIARFAADGASARTTEGKVIGTLGYLAPERLAGAPAAEAADVYAVGVCLYEMLTGKRPFDAKRSDFIEAVMKEPPPDVRALAPEVGEALAGVIARALEKGPKARFVSARQMFDALKEATTGLVGVAQPPAHPPVTPPPPRRDAPRAGRGVVFALAVTASLAVGAIVIAFALVLSGGGRTPRALDAEQEPRDAAGASALVDVASPDASAREGDDAVTDAEAPPTHSAAAPKLSRCLCRDDFMGEPLCTAPQVPICECHGFCMSLCTLPYVEDGGTAYCPGVKKRVLPAAKKGDPCEGYCATYEPDGRVLRAPSLVKPMSGKLDCYVCTKPDRVLGRHLAPCRGVDIYGNERTGKLDCR